jgi:voltage-gated potassium channel
VQQPVPLKQRVHRQLASPQVDAAVLVLVLLSVLLLIPELALSPRSPVQRVAEQLGHLLTCVFVVELGLRFWVAPYKRRFFARYWTDILAVLPVIRAVRLFRVLRVLRLVRAGVLMNRNLSLRASTAETTAMRLMVLSAASGVLVLGATQLLRELEPQTLGRRQEALWFSLYSLIAGEPVGPAPDSNLGHLVVLGLMIGGVTVFALFVATLSATMVDRLSTGMLMRDIELDELSGHTLICGWNGSGPTLLRELFHPTYSDRAEVVLITEGEMPTDLPTDVLDPRRFFHHRGDYTRVEVLEEVGVRKAATAILLTDTTIPRSDQDRDARTVLAALTMERMAGKIYTVAEVTSRQSERLLSMAGVEEIVVGDWYAGVIMGSASRNRGLVGVLDEVLSTEGNGFHTVDAPPGLQGQTVAEVRRLLHEQHEATLIAIHRGRESLVNPAGGVRIESGDKLVVLCLVVPRVG